MKAVVAHAVALAQTEEPDPGVAEAGQVVDGLGRPAGAVDIYPRVPRVLHAPRPSEGDEPGALVEQPVGPDVAVVGVGQDEAVDDIAPQEVVEHADLFVVGTNRKRQHVVPTRTSGVT